MYEVFTLTCYRLAQAVLDWSDKEKPHSSWGILFLIPFNCPPGWFLDKDFPMVLGYITMNCREPLQIIRIQISKAKGFHFKI